MVNEIKRDTVDYRDPTPFDNSKLQSLSEISQALRHKTYGADTREAMAQQGEALAKLMQETGGNQSAEVAAARGGHETLSIREDAQDNAVAVTNAKLANKADKDYINKYLSQVSYSPETVASLAELNAKYPNGKPGLFVAADNGHKYLWQDNKWVDKGIYQAAGIADKSIDWNKLKVPMTRGYIILGNIIVNAGTINFSKNLALDYNGGYLYPDRETTLQLPSDVSPVYVTANRETKEYAVTPVAQTNTLTNADVMIGILYDSRFYVYGQHGNHFVKYDSEKYDPVRNNGSLVYGELQVDYVTNNIRSTTDTSIITCFGKSYRIEHKLNVKIPVDSDKQIVFIFYDYVNGELLCVNNADVLNRSHIYLFALYQGIVYDSSDQHITFINRNRLVDREPETSIVLSSNSNKISIIEKNEKGTVTIPASSQFYVNSNGLLLKISSQIIINYENKQIDVDNKGLLTFFYEVNTQQIYADYFKRKSVDVKLFSIYDGKIYGSNLKGFIVNDIEDGGWAINVNSDGLNYDLMNWYQNAISSKQANIAWLGDSTWEGYRVKNPDNIFPVYLNSLLTNEFSGIKSFNCSKGGYSTKQLYENFATLTANSTGIGLLMIGGGLNDTADYNGLVESEKYLDLLVKKARDNGWTPVIATTQATALLYATTATGGDWNKQQAGFDLINKMKRRYAEKNNVDLLDLEKYSHDFIENSPASMADMFTDYLHGQDPIHIFEANVAMAYLSQHCDFMVKNQLIGITTMNARSNVPYNKAYQPLGEVENGFKVKFNYTATTNDRLIDYQLFIPADGNTWQLDGFNSGNTVKVTVNGKSYDVTTDGKICELPIGYYHIICTTTTGTVDFKGLKVRYG